MTYKALDEHQKAIKKLLRTLQASRKVCDWAFIQRYLLKGHPRIHNQFSRFDEDGFEKVGRDPFDIWCADNGLALFESTKDVANESIEQLLIQATDNVHSLVLPQRRRLVAFWTQDIRSETTDRLFELVKDVDTLQKRLTRVHDEVDRRVLQTADVIGVTTTGLARRIVTLQHVRSKVVICEEAGEVMEPHILSALLPSVEHFVQIGDHQQLRPQINNYNLSLESQQGASYQLDRSQFERLSVGERGRPSFPVAQLNVQRRMRPEISTLIRETMYPRLLDHTSTKTLPSVVGMRKDVFWLNHENYEEGARADAHQKSHSNLWEVNMIHALVRHILRQGVYNSTDIAVLTPYTGQLQKIRSKMRNDFEIVLSERDQETLTKDGYIGDDIGSENDDAVAQMASPAKLLEKKQMSDLLRVATVDNFQGEEAKVIIVSLVRSNNERKVGFLKTTNRINVLLSRAQHGMYLIGNMNTYSNQPMWSRVQGMLQGADCVGKALGLCCPRHIDTEIHISEPDDFARFSPEGGCQLPCDRRLPNCGHRCLAKCHSESLHLAFSCPQQCQRLHKPCNHMCQKSTCGEDCGQCETRIDDVQLPCTHSKDHVPCYLTQDLDLIKCVVLVHKEVPGCKHTVEVQCLRDVSSELFKCPTPCVSTLGCGHLCPGTCGRCSVKDSQGRPVVMHSSCSKICGRRFGACNHTCPRLCHDGQDCGPCLSACEVCSFIFCFCRCCITGMHTSIFLIRYRRLDVLVLSRATEYDHQPPSICNDGNGPQDYIFPDGSVLHKWIKANLFRSAVHIHGALYDVTKHAHHASSHARGPASIRDPALCHVRPRVPDFLAIYGVHSSCLAAISAQEFVARSARKNTAKYAQTEEKNEWIYLR